jgi:hypothetical protein
MAALALVLHFLATGPSPLSSTPFSSSSDFAQWMTYYYTHPEPDRVLPAIDYYAHSDLYAKEDTRFPVAEFAAAALQNHLDLQRQMGGQLTESSTSALKTMTALTLWLLDTEASSSSLKAGATNCTGDAETCSLIGKLSSHPPPKILTEPVGIPMTLDMLWARFFATGDAAPVDKIAAQVHRFKGHGTDILIGGVAKWSITSNIRQHPRVREIVKHELSTAAADDRPLLEQALRDAGGKEK